MTYPLEVTRGCEPRGHLARYLSLIGEVARDDPFNNVVEACKVVNIVARIVLAGFPNLPQRLIRPKLPPDLFSAALGNTPLYASVFSRGFHFDDVVGGV